MDWRRAKSLDHFVRGAVFLGPLQHVFGWLFSDAIFLNVADHLPHGDLVIEHVANGIHAQWALFLGRAFRRFGVAYQMRELLVFDLDRADRICCRGFVDRGHSYDIVARPVNVGAWSLHDMNCFHAGHFLGGTGINTNDLGVRIRTAQHLAIKHARAVHVIGVLRLSGNLGGSIHASDTSADPGYTVGTGPSTAAFPLE